MRKNYFSIIVIVLLTLSFTRADALYSIHDLSNNSTYAYSYTTVNNGFGVLKGNFSELHSMNINGKSILSLGRVNRVRTLADVSTSNPDPETSKQWALTMLEQGKLFDRQARGSGIIVAVVDTGVEKTHPEISGRVIAGFDVYDPHSDGSNDNNGHGTHVAGIIAGSRNGTGIEGLAPESIIMPIKVLDASGFGDDADVAKGLAWAVDHGANIVNMSLGGTDPNSVLADAVLYAKSKNVAVVAAAGNNGSASPIIYPASDPGVLAVGATGGSSKAAFFSSQGQWVDIAAPGVSILSTWRNNSYRIESGTSMASPYVAASIALLSSYLKISSIEAEQLLINTCTDVPVLDTADGTDRATGCGIVDPYWALDHTSSRALSERVAVPASQLPVDVIAPSLELPKLVAPTLPAVPTPKLPKVTLPSPSVPALPNYEKPMPGVSNKPLLDKTKKSSIKPVVTTKRGMQSLKFTSYLSYENTIVNVTSNGLPFSNEAVLVRIGSSSIKARTNYIGRILIKGKVDVISVTRG